MANTAIKQKLIDDLPSGFLEQLLFKIEGAYKTAHESMSTDPTLGQYQAKTVIGHYRRGIVETILADCALDHGLKCNTIPFGERGVDTRVQVEVGDFLFTQSKVSSPNGFPSLAKSRVQSSKANEYAAQMNFFDEQNSQDQIEDTHIYGVIIHTSEPDDSSDLRSLYIGFPNPDFTGWIAEPVEVKELIEESQVNNKVSTKSQAKGKLKANKDNKVKRHKVNSNESRNQDF